MPHRIAAPGIYIAGTSQHSGKTLVSLGLVAALRDRGLNVRYMKPVGQRTVEVNGVHVDEDVILINTVYDLDSDAADCNPVTIPSGYTTDFVRNGGSRQPLIDRILDSYERLSRGADLVIVEGTGHAGVGSVVGMGNAQVAALLGAGAMIVTGGGLGRPIDEFALNRAMFDQEGCRIIGMVANKFLPKKIDELKPLLAQWLAQSDDRLLGVVPYEPILSELTMRQIASETGAEIIHGEQYLDRRISECLIGAQYAHRLLQALKPGVLAIIPGDRDDLILAAISSEELSSETAGTMGICITGGIMPHHSVLRLIERSQAPVIAIREGTYDVASEISDVVGKMLPSDREKVETGQRLVKQAIDLDAVLEAL
ncbi:MAG: AAA family ATPase [candidate division WS1 bacterium]|nr:AAA family ATPase [candidate division WS1 bacterium]